MGFLTSKFSGYLSLILIAALIAGAWYMYQRGVTFGELKEAADQLAAIEDEQKQRRAQLARQDQAIRAGRKEAAEIRERLRAARDAANEDFDRCFNMPVPDGMRIRQQ